MADCGDAKVIDVLMVDDDEGDVLMTREAFEYYKIRNRLHVVPDGDQAVSGAGDPGSDGPVLEPYDQLHLHLHRAIASLHDPVNGGVGVIGRHEVDHRHAA